MLGDARSCRCCAGQFGYYFGGDGPAPPASRAGDGTSCFRLVNTPVARSNLLFPCCPGYSSLRISPILQRHPMQQGLPPNWGPVQAAPSSRPGSPLSRPTLQGMRQILHVSSGAEHRSTAGARQMFPYYRAPVPVVSLTPIWPVLQMSGTGFFVLQAKMPINESAFPQFGRPPLIDQIVL